ncbi:uncharacterized protein LOC132720047 [Ruditapes philippinarum]|uniref:uncharacterized protein LOC132720047 n=1 Tax=Ruditapes philippinarum TaxID=129788 RepID=UPI00295B816B|nr:uncharacterized protein LOC132720047 [Ruditapes philippinarum]
MAALSSSFSDGSDILYDYACAPCATECKNVEADKFCVDCNHLLCSVCIGHHNKFDFMRGHQMLDKTASNGSRGKEKTDMPTMRCSKHDGKIIDMFCKSHDEPCCIVCASVYHSTCPDKDYLPNVAKTNMNIKEWQSMKTSAQKFKTRLQKSKEKRESNLESISNQMSVILVKIKEKRNMINDKFNALENDIKAKVDMKLIEYSSELTEEIEKLNEYINIIDGYEETMACTEENKSDNYIRIKQLQHQLKSGTKLLANLCQPNKSIHFFETCNMSEIFEMLEKVSFGHISGSGAVESVVVEADVNIKSRDDTTVCCISDSCLMENGEVILSDQNNRNIKKLDCSFQLKEWIALPGKPCAVCPTGGSEIAVSLLNKKTIQFVSTGSPMATLSSIRIGESCRGIVYIDSKLYLSCGGMTKYQDGPGEIRVYEKSGTFIRKFDTGVKVPKRMALSSDKIPVDVFIADEENGVLCIDTSDQPHSVRTICQYQDLLAPVGLCYMGKGQIAVCGYDSNNIMLISKSGVLMKELWSKTHGVVKPKTTCLDHTGYKMLVGITDTDHIKVGHLIRS